MAATALLAQHHRLDTQAVEQADAVLGDLKGLHADAREKDIEVGGAAHEVGHLALVSHLEFRADPRVRFCLSSGEVMMRIQECTAPSWAR